MLFIHDFVNYKAKNRKDFALQFTKSCISSKKQRFLSTWADGATRSRNPKTMMRFTSKSGTYKVMMSLLVISFWWEEENLVAAQQQEGLVPPYYIARVFESSRAEVKVCISLMMNGSRTPLLSNGSGALIVREPTLFSLLPRAVGRSS